jgi:hypothetical protein
VGSLLQNKVEIDKLIMHIDPWHLVLSLLVNNMISTSCNPMSGV